MNKNIQQSNLMFSYVLSDIDHIVRIVRIRWAGRIAGLEETINAYRLLIGKHNEKSLLSIPKRSRVDNINMSLRQESCEDGTS
jgi:hypothetical protein